MLHFDVVTIGSAVKDIMFYHDEVFVIKNKKDLKRQKLLAVEYGAKIPIDEVHVNYGGGAMNVAVGLKNFGFTVAPMINVGQDMVGREIYSYLKNKRINTSLMTVSRKYRTGFSMIMTAQKDKEHTIFTFKGASNYLNPRFSRDSKMRWLYVSSLTNQNWEKQMEKITRQVNRAVKIAWNPGVMQLKDYAKSKKFLRDIEILFLNRDEATEFVMNCKKKITKKKLQNIKFLLTELRLLGANNVVITDGEKGAHAMDKDGEYFQGKSVVAKKQIVDTVGAGDAFASGFMAGFMRWKKVDSALDMGMRNSRGVLTQIGAQNGLLKLNMKEK